MVAPSRFDPHDCSLATARGPASAERSRRREIQVISAPVPAVNATSNQPALWTPCAAPIRPKQSAIGRNTSQDTERTPEATPALTAEGIWAIVTTINEVATVSTAAAAVIATATPAARGGRRNPSRPATTPPRPRADISAAQCGP